MNRNTGKIMVLISILLSLALLTACSPESSNTPTGSVEVSYENEEGVADAAKYVVELTTENGDSIVKETEDKTITISDVAVGNWTVSVAALDASGAPVSASCQNLSVSKSKVAKASLLLRGTATVTIHANNIPDYAEHYVLLVSYGDYGLRSYVIDKGELDGKKITVPASTTLTFTLRSMNREYGVISESKWKNFSIIGSTDEHTFDLQERKYNIGDKGPAGGIIFYVNPNYKADGWKYLEAAPTDYEDIKGVANQRVCFGYYVPEGKRGIDETQMVGTGSSDSKEMGMGKENTAKLYSTMGEKTSVELRKTTRGTYAAQLVSNLTINGYSDWFIPSEEEAVEMGKYKTELKLRDGEKSYYLTSNEENCVDCFVLRMSSNTCISLPKEDNNVSIRAIRRF